ncbi:MAG: glycoside hydrolase family 127 protein, partial [Planctomycetes bacterium]|nr:glycoside hydrolase family 127 protein [Planctomycetota bacterium]
PRIETVRTVTIPFAIRMCEETGRIDNFAKAARRMEGEHEGQRYNDSDVFKVIEGASYSLRVHPDPVLEARLDDWIAKIAAAQEPDGYLYTARTIDPANPVPGAGETRWSNLAVSHELYNMGHLLEAAVAHHLATGKRSLLDVAIRSADLVARVFGPGERPGAPGHQEIEIGLVRLYRLTGDETYLRLAKHFLDERGKPYPFTRYPPESRFAVYNDPEEQIQWHAPVVEQAEAVGHAVRAAYMYSGMADIAALTGDAAYTRALDRIWGNVVGRKLYLTGGIGARHDKESFGADYELPNRTAYAETCASIANVFWAHRLFLLHGDAAYIDVLERTLYNALLAGMSLNGDRFFYPNPLEFDGAFPFNQGSAERKPWFDCACCPVNLVRLLSSLSGYVYATSVAGGRTDLYVSLYVASSADLEIGGVRIRVAQETRYPWDGDVRIAIDPDREVEFALRLRIPGWAANRPVPSDLYRYEGTSGERPRCRLNGRDIDAATEKGWLGIDRRWRPGDEVVLDLPMPVRRVRAHEAVEEDRGKVAIERGPLVYCVEGADNRGVDVLDLVLPADADLAPAFREDLLGGVVAIAGKAPSFTAIPYALWGNRGADPMAVWFRL